MFLLCLARLPSSVFPCLALLRLPSGFGRFVCSFVCLFVCLVGLHVLPPIPLVRLLHPLVRLFVFLLDCWPSCIVFVFATLFARSFARLFAVLFEANDCGRSFLRLLSRGWVVNVLGR